MIAPVIALIGALLGQEGRDGQDAEQLESRLAGGTDEP